MGKFDSTPPAFTVIVSLGIELAHMPVFCALFYRFSTISSMIFSRECHHCGKGMPRQDHGSIVNLQSHRQARQIAPESTITYQCWSFASDLRSTASFQILDYRWGSSIRVDLIEGTKIPACPKCSPEPLFQCISVILDSFGSISVQNGQRRFLSEIEMKL